MRRVTVELLLLGQQRHSRQEAPPHRHGTCGTRTARQAAAPGGPPRRPPGGPGLRFLAPAPSRCPPPAPPRALPAAPALTQLPSEHSPSTAPIAPPPPSPRRPLPASALSARRPPPSVAAAHWSSPPHRPPIGKGESAAGEKSALPPAAYVL